MKTTLMILLALVSSLGSGCAPPDPDDDSSVLDSQTIDGIWRVRADEVFDDCNDEENLCAEGEDDGCIYSNEWFWVTVQDYTDGIFTADFAMSDLYWEDIIVEDGAFENTLDLSMYGWLHNISGTMTAEEMTATIELGALDLENPESKFICRITYELWGYPLYDANAAGKEALTRGSGTRYSPLSF